MAKIGLLRNIATSKEVGYEGGARSPRLLVDPAFTDGSRGTTPEGVAYEVQPVVLHGFSRGLRG